MDDEALSRLVHQDRGVHEVLVFTFDVEFRQGVHPWFELSEALFEPFAVDATGGIFGRVMRAAPRENQLLHVECAGAVSSLGHTLADALAVILQVPAWREVLEAARRGATVAALRTTALALEDDAQQDLPALPAARDTLFASLEIPRLEDPVQALHSWNLESRTALRVLPREGENLYTSYF